MWPRRPVILIALAPLLLVAALYHLVRPAPIHDAAARPPVPASSLLAGAEQAMALAPGEVVEATLDDGGHHLYRLAVAPGGAARVAVDQGGEVDVELAVLDGAGRELRFFDTPSGRKGIERLTLVVPAEPTFLRVAAFAGESGRYRLELAGGAPAGEADHAAARAERQYLRGRRLNRRGELAGASVAFRRAAELWEATGDPRAAQFAWPDLGDVAHARRQPARARFAFQRAWDELAHREPGRQSARVANQLAILTRAEGDAVTALSLARSALEMARALELPSDGAVYLRTIGDCLDDLGEPDLALEAYARALSAHRALGEATKVPGVHNRLAEIYRGMGDLERAEASYRAGHEAAGTAADLDNQARALDGLGTLDRHRYDEQEDRELLLRAERRFYAALALYRRIGDPEGEATVTNNLGRIYRLLDEPRRAIEFYRRSVEHFEALDEPGDAASVGVNLAWLEHETGDLRAARARYRRALEVCGRRGDIRCEASAAYGLGRLAADQGDLDLARRLAERAVEIVESMRTRADRGMRITYLADKYDYYLLWIEALSRLDERRPGRGFAEQAFAVGERGRARGLLEFLVAAGETPPEPLGLDELRRGLIDERTALLATSVGEHEAFAWLVTARGLELRRLPARAELGRRVADLHRALAAPGPLARRTDAAAMRLADDLLVPFLPTLERQGIGRLLVAADGDLHRVPVGPLFDLAGLRPPALEAVVHLPSASVQESLARRRAARPAGGRTAAALVVADPVLRADDPRVAGPPPSAPSAPRARVRAGSLDELARLPATAREARALCDRLPSAECLELTGFAATREALLETDLRPYRYLHFATHTLIDDEDPEGSRIVLSRRDRQGRPRPGLLSLADIRGLDLAADLVVLSGCHTANGRMYRGEGPIGVARGFLEAGAASVLVSLWEVDDEATAELIDQFYAGLLDRGLPAAAALDEAQRYVAAQPGWSAPYFWAGFQLLGEAGPPAAAPVPSRD